MPLVGGMQLPAIKLDISPEAIRAHNISNVNRATIWNSVSTTVAARVLISASHELCEASRDLIREVKERKAKWDLVRKAGQLPAALAPRIVLVSTVPEARGLDNPESVAPSGLVEPEAPPAAVCSRGAASLHERSEECAAPRTDHAARLALARDS